MIDTQAPDFLVLARNPSYHGASAPIEVISYESHVEETALKLLRRDSLDLVQVSPVSFRALLEAVEPSDPLRNGAIRYEKTLELGFVYIGWNLIEGPTRDRRVRRALTHALNRERVLVEAFGGWGEVSNGPFPSRSPDNDPTVAPLPFDLGRAAALLDEAGWSVKDPEGRRGRWRGGTFEPLVIDVLHNSRAEWVVLFEIFRRDLERVGVTLNSRLPQGLDDDLDDRLARGDFSGFIGGWGMDWENDLYQVWHSSQADIPSGSNRIGFKNAEADRLIEAVREAQTEDARYELQHQLHRVIHDEQPYTFVVEEAMIIAFGRRLRGVRLSEGRPHDNTLSWWIDE